MLIWPYNKMLNIIRKKIFKQLMKLVNLAGVNGLQNNELLAKLKPHITTQTRKKNMDI